MQVCIALLAVEEAHLKMQFAYCIYRKYQSGKMLPSYFSQQQQSD